MKAIVTLLAVAAAVGFTSCEADNKGKLDPNAKVYINGSTAPASVAEASKAGQQRLTPLEVVKQADQLYNTAFSGGISDQHRDLTNVRIVVHSTWVIGSRGELGVEMFESSNNILVTDDPKTLAVIDTIAYIPNATMRAAEVAIKAAYAAQDYAACYRLFEKAFVFLPTTGAEYKALQQQGLN